MDTRNIYCSLLAGSYFVQLEGKTWADARQHCVDNDAHLMEVRTQEEYDRALGIWDEVGNFWLGGNDIEEEGVWVWNSNGEVIDMSRFWLAGRPYAGETGRNCLMMASDTGFEDYNCAASSYSYVCEYQVFT